MPSRTGGVAFQLLATELAVTAPPDLWTWAVADASVHRALERWLRYEMWFSIFHGIYAAIVVGVALILLRRARKRVAVAMGSFAKAALYSCFLEMGLHIAAVHSQQRALSSKAGEEDWSANIRWSSFAWRLSLFKNAVLSLSHVRPDSGTGPADLVVRRPSMVHCPPAPIRARNNEPTNDFPRGWILGISSTSLKVLYFLVEPSVALYFLGQWFACLHFLCCAAMDKAENVIE